MLVDHVVLDPQQMMTTEVAHVSRRTAFRRLQIPTVPFGPGKIIARRAAQEIRPGVVSIFGFGASSDTPLVMAEQGAFDDGGQGQSAQQQLPI